MLVFYVLGGLIFMDEIKYIYLVIVPNDISKLIELKSFKLDDYLDVCQNIGFVHPDHANTYVFLNRQTAIDKYCEERGKRIKEIVDQINNLKANYYDQNNWNPYSIDGENEW